jgi:hypothetical protein
MDPSWTDIIQAIAAVIAVPGAITAFVLLFLKDKDKEKQIQKLSLLAEKIEFQNEILKESNSIMSRQVEALGALSIPDKQSEASIRLLQIEEEKRELEFRPKLYSNMYNSAESSGSHHVENGGKQITILSLESDNKNIQLINGNELIGKTIPEKGFFIIQTRTLDRSVMNNKNYNVTILCENDLGLKYQIVMNSHRMDSLRTSTKIE